MLVIVYEKRLLDCYAAKIYLYSKPCNNSLPHHTHCVCKEEGRGRSNHNSIFCSGSIEAFWHKSIFIHTQKSIDVYQRYIF